MTPVGPSELGNFVIEMAAILSIILTLLGCAVAVKKLFFDPKPRDHEVITRIEFERLVGECAKKEEVEEIKDSLEKLDAYVHTHNHSIRNELHGIGLRLATMAQKIEDRDQFLDKLLGKTEEVALGMERVLGMMSGVKHLQLPGNQSP